MGENVITKNNCNVFIENIDTIKGIEAEILPCIASYYEEKYKRIIGKKQDNMKQTAYEELLAGYMLYKYLGIMSDAYVIRNVHGKPEISLEYMSDVVDYWKKDHPDYEYKEINFNLSHSKGYVVLAVSDKPIGVDIESIERLNFKVAKRILRVEQLEHLEEINAAEQSLARQKSAKPEQIEFTKYWTQYEAIMKLVGTGFAGKLDDKTMIEYEKRVWFYEFAGYVIAVVRA